MRTFLGTAVALILYAAQAQAGDQYILRQNQTGLDLPGVSIPQGSDEVRAADGTSCRSSNAGNGAYADVGVIGSTNQDSWSEGNAVYGRVVIPLSATGKRLDCRRLYDLEIERLQMEVRMLKAGLTNRSKLASDSTELTDESWETTPPKKKRKIR